MAALGLPENLGKKVGLVFLWPAPLFSHAYRLANEGFTLPVRVDRAVYRDSICYAPCPEKNPCRRRGKLCNFLFRRHSRDQPVSDPSSSAYRGLWRYHCHDRQNMPAAKAPFSTYLTTIHFH